MPAFHDIIIKKCYQTLYRVLLKPLRLAALFAGQFTFPVDPAKCSAAAGSAQPRLARKLGLFDATMIVMGGIIGSGIFMNPYVVAQQVHTPFLILGAWALGGLIALAGAFIYAELAERRPQTGGQYAYL